jgi:hypothetical protein
MLEFNLGSKTMTVLLAVTAVFGGLATMPHVQSLRLPGNDQGYAPVQPIAFSHRLHAGELQLDCQYCHQGAQTSRYAGVPAASTCMNCHKFISATLAANRAEDDAATREKRSPKRIVSPELRKLYDAVGLDPELRRDPLRPQQPINWVRIHKLPDHAVFPHDRHVNAGVACQTCHGPVEQMERMRQHATLSMGWCVGCHRDSGLKRPDGSPLTASLDCAGCHH